jgi:diguanylate cyclase (GGDEF)-like protein
MFVDLDHFKHLNDALGHLVGDMLLKQVAERMRALVRGNDTIGRLGGDEFVVLLESLSAEASTAANEARRIAEKLVAALNRPFILGEYEHHISVSLGVALFPDQSVTAEEILKQADTAMYRSKANGRNTLRFFEPAMQAAAEMRLAMEKALRHALAEGEFALYLQPEVGPEGHITSAEALLRWARPGLAPLPPGAFIAVAEESGLIIPLGEWVLTSACQVIRETARAGRPHKLSVNVSLREFRNAEFVSRVKAVLERTGADPSFLTLELTESAVIKDFDDATRKMAALGECGIRFAIDDFGTGHSSLAYLRRLPVSEIKIDGSFIAEVIADPNDAAIVDAILAMGDRLGLKVVAEGVESAEQMRFLKERGCRYFQGYLYGPPLPVDKYFEWLKKW